MRGYLSLYTLYDHPADYPESYIIREFRIGPDETVIAMPGIFLEGKNLDFIRHLMENVHHRVFLYRNKQDDPCIMGTYV